MGELLDKARSTGSSRNTGSLLAKARATQLIEDINALQERSVNLGHQHNARYFDSSGQALSSSWRADSSDWLNTVKSQYDRHITEVGELTKRLKQYRSYFDEDTFAKAMDAIDASSNSNRQIYDRASAESAAFSRFQNADDYNRAVELSNLYTGWDTKTEKQIEEEWNNLNHNLTLAYGADDAASIDATNKRLGDLTGYILGTERLADTPVSAMAADYRYNRNIEQRDSLRLDKQAAAEWGANHAMSYGDEIVSEFERYQMSPEEKVYSQELDRLNREILTHERSPQYIEMSNINLRKQKGYDEKAASRPYTNPTRAEMDAYDAADHTTQSAPIVNDPLRVYLDSSQKDKEDAVGIVANAHENGKSSTYYEYVAMGGDKRWDLLTKDEINDYYYYLSESPEAGRQYLDRMETVLNARAMREYNKEISELPLAQRQALSVMSSIYYSVLSPIEGVKATLLYGLGGITGKNLYDKNDNKIISRTDAFRANTAEEMNKSGKTFLGVPIGNLFQGVVSGADSLMMALYTLGAGIFIPETASATALKVFREAPGAALGMSAARSKMDQVYDEGGRIDQVLVSGLNAYATEWLTERFSIGMFLDDVTNAAIKNKLKAVKSIAAQVGVNAAEEGAARLMETALDWMTLHRTEYTDIIRQKMAEGKSREEAAKDATHQFLIDLLGDIFGGAIGGAMFAGASIVSSAAYNSMNKAYATDIIENKMVDRTIASAQTTLTQLKEGSGQYKRLNAAIEAAQKEASVKNVQKLLRQFDLAVTSVSANAISEMAPIIGEDAAKQLKSNIKTSGENLAVAQMVSDEALAKKAVEREMKVGVGMTNKHTGEDIKITGIYRTREKGKPTLVYKLDDGGTIRAQDVSYASDNMAIMAETLASTGIRADYAMALLNTVSEGESGVYVKEGIPEAIRSGMIGENYAMARKNRLAAELSDEQFRLAYEAGQALARDDLNRRKGRASQKTAADVRLGVEDGKLVGTFYDGTQTPVSRVENGASARTLTNTSEDGTVSSDDVKNMARNKGYAKPAFPSQYKTLRGVDARAHYEARQWADTHQNHDRGIIEADGYWYVIEQFDDMESNYQVVTRLTMKQYEKVKGDIENVRKSIQQENGSRDVYNSNGLVDGRDVSRGESTRNDIVVARYGREGNSVHEVGSQAHSLRWTDPLYRSGLGDDRQRHQSGQTASGSGKGSGGDKNSYRNAQETVKTTESQKVEGEPSEGLSFVVTDQGVRRETTQAQINVLEAVAKITNTNIEVYASTVVNGERQFVDRRGRIHKGNAAYTRDGNTIMVDIHAGDYLSGLMFNAVSHELVHYIREMNPEGFRALADFVVAKFGEKGESVSDLIRAKQEKYKKAGETLTFDGAYEEVVADSLESMLSQNVEKVMQDIAELRRVDADVAQTLVDKLKEWTGKLLRVFKKNRFDSKPETYEGKCFAKWSEFHEELSHLFAQGVAGAADRSAQAARRTLTKENTSDQAEVKNMIRNDAYGNPYVEITENILSGVRDLTDYAKVRSVVENELKTRFPNGFNWRGWKIALTGVGRREFIRSGYTDKLIKGASGKLTIQEKATFPFSHAAEYQQAFEDKMRVAANLDEIVEIANQIKNENPNHQRKDKISSFNRGKIRISVGQYDYVADVVTAVYPASNEIFYDIVNLRPTSIKKKTVRPSSMSPMASTTGGNRTASNKSISKFTKKSNPQIQKSSNSLRNVTERQTILAMLKTMNSEIEHNKYFKEYLEKAEEVDKMQQRLDEVNREWRKGAGNAEAYARRQELRKESMSLMKQIDELDQRLLRLGELRPFRNIVRNAVQRQKAEDAQKLSDYRKTVKTRAEREKVMRIIKDIGSYVLHESKDHHIPAELRKQFAETLSEINLDFSAGHNQQVRDYLNRLGDALDQMKKSDSPLVQTWSDSFIVDMLDAVKEKVGKVSVHDMNQEQLDAVYQLLRVMKKRITSSNRMQAENIQKTASKMAQDATEQIRQWKTKYSHKTTQFSLDNLKPIYFFDRLGSEALQKLYQNILYGQYTYANDLREADEFRKTLEKKYHVENWAMSKAYTFQDRENEEMHLTLADILSLYAHSRREQSRNHLFKHGIVLDEEVVIERNAGGKVKRYKVDDKKNHPLDLDVINRIFAEALTKEMKNYVEDMQDYLSDVMGAKGNEVSLALYDIELFREKHYWPLKTAAWWNAFNPEAVVEPKIKSPSFAKAVNKYATSPIVLQGFSAVWSQHVHDMSMYHGLALPVDDFTRVVNARTIENPVNVGGVRQAMEEVFGVGAGRYVSQLMRDLNGGIRSTDDAWLTKGVSLTKKAATALSLSVAIQQPSSIVRAMAIIEPKYFGKLDKDLRVKGIAAQYDELKKYCPVAYIKEMGNMDTGIGRSAVEYLQRRGFGDAKVIDILKDENYRKQLGSKIDDVIGFLPQFMDQVTWVKIWRAAQNKVQALHPEYASHQIKQEAAKIFNDVIERTQVYDSVLSRSGMMRKGGAATKQATAFLSEATTTINMTYMAIVNAHRNKPGAKAMLWRTLGAVYGATLFNAILKSIITAMRDDDEDETMIEKYVEHLVGNFLSDALVFTNLPYVRDILSLLQGYDVERMDMGLVSDLTRAIGALGRDDVTVEEVLDIVLLVTAMFGIPLNNVKRDIKGMLNLIQTVSDEISGKLKTTWTGILGAMHDGLPFVKERNKSDLLYYAYKSGRSEDIRYYRSRFDDATAADKAIKSELWNRESEVFDATQLRYYGNVARSSALVNKISERTGVPLGLVQNVVMAKTETFRDEKKPTDEYDGTDEAKSVAPESYTLTDLKLALEQGRETDAVIEGIISDKMTNGTTAKQAKNQVRQSVWNTYRASYYEAYKSNDKAEMERIRTLLMSSGLWSSTELNNTIKNYIKNQED